MTMRNDGAGFRSELKGRIYRFGLDVAGSDP